MTRRERVLKALAFEETDRVPMDLGGMGSTGISCFAYPDLVEALGLPPRRPRIYDPGQMLALPDVDVLDALGCDVVMAGMDFTNAFDQPDLWHPYDFNGRLDTLVRDPSSFQIEPDGTIVQPADSRSMPPAAHVFEQQHGGQPIDLMGNLPKPDLTELRAQLEKNHVTDAQLRILKAMLERVRDVSDRAVLFNGPGAGIGIGNFLGIAMFPMLCLTEPDYVAELHELVISYAIENVQAILAEVHPLIDLYQSSSDDWGTQEYLVASPETFATLFKPYYRRFTDAIHKSAPNVKAFLHSCGAIHSLVEQVIECGFDVLNPVQWTAGDRGYAEWKAVCDGRLALWGGGVNTQATLPLGSIDDIEREVHDVVRCMRQGGGYIFCAIHNILAEIPGDKVVALYRAAANA